MSEAGIGPGLDPAAHPEGAWPVPVEVVLALPTSSVMRALIVRRRVGQDHPLPVATLFLRGNRFFAEVRFNGPARPGLVFALDVWAWENQP